MLDCALVTPAAEPCLLLLDASIARTGALVCARHMARALHDLARCDLVLPVVHQIPAEDLADFDSVFFLPLRNPGSTPWSLFSWFLILVTTSLQLRFLLHRHRTSHLILNDWYLLHGIVCRLLGYQGQIITWVRLDPLRFGRLLASIIFRLVAISSNQIIVVSRFVQARLPEGVPARLLYDAIGKPESLVAYPTGQRIVYVSNYIPGKGQDLAIDAFALVADRHPLASLSFHGGTLGRLSNQRWRQRLEARAAALGLNERIHFHGFAEDSLQPLHGALVALNLSQSESFSLTVLEAAASGVAVVATDCGGPAEIIDNEITGILVPLEPRTVAAAAHALDDLLGNPIRAAQLGQAARLKVTTFFTPERYQHELRTILGL